MEKQVVEFVAKRIVYETNLSVVDVVSRLNEELNKDQAGPEVFKSLGAAKTRSDVEQAVQNAVFEHMYEDFVRTQLIFSASEALSNDRHQYQGLGDCFCLTEPRSTAPFYVS